MINPQRKKFFITISYLIWAAMSFRWFSVDLTPDWLENRLIIIPLLIYGLLLGMDTLLTHGVQWRVLLYLAFQSSLIFYIAVQALDLDFFYLLLLPLVGQSIILLPRRSAYIVIGTFIAVTGFSLIAMNGWPKAASFIVLYTASIIFTMGYSILMIQSDEDRRKAQKLLIELQEYSEKATQLAVVEERNRLARELHDSVTQALYGLTLQSEAMARQLESGQDSLPPEEMRELRDIAQQALQEMRLMIFELRPAILKDEGLAAALQSRLESVENRSGFHTSLKYDFQERLPFDLENEFYGIAREALNNISKHAQARQIDIRLSPGRENRILFEISDDGVGFDSENPIANGGLGLKGIKERAEKLDAILSISSQPTKGTRIRVEVKR